MRNLSTNSLKKAEMFIEEYGRNLEKAFYNYYFHKNSCEDVVRELKKYQNDDGGFGKGLEPDFRLPLSSPIASTVAFQYLVQIDDSREAMDMIKSGIRYFEDIFNKERKGWFAVPKEVNEYAHAPWWNYNEKEGMTVIDYSWGNPSAEIIGYLYKYRNFVRKLEVYELVNFAINNLNNKGEFKSEHEIYCYIRLYNLLPNKLSSKMKDKLTLAVGQLVCNDKDKWVEYVPQPLHFVKGQNEDRFGINDEDIEENLEYLINNIDENRGIKPSWNWGNYKEEWKDASRDWAGLLTLRALMTLDRFNRL